MKIKLNIYLLLIPALLLWGGCGNTDKDQSAHEHGAGETTYTCPMHPQIVQNEPGSCPICGMDLVLQAAHGESVEITEDLAFLLEPTNRTVVASISTTSPVMKAVETSVKMEGIITYDPRRVYNIPARVGGRIEQLYVRYNYQPISKGQKLMEIYSPELVTAQKELLYLVQSAGEDTQLIEGAKQRLLLLGATQEQVNRLIRTGEASYTFPLYSPYSGYVIGLNNTPPTATSGSMQNRSTPAAGGGMAGMGGGAGGTAPAAGNIGSGGNAGEGLPLREGMYIAAGQALLRVVNTEQLWAEFNIPAGYVSSIAKGAPVEITFPGLPDERLEAQVDFFQPFYEAGENFARLRVYLPGQQSAAMVGQLVSGSARYTTPPSLWVPKEAVLDIGSRSVAFVKQGAAFRPVAVSTGISEEGQTQILDGLQENDVLASNAQFMVDSESFIRVNN
ncbi:Cu(I)/Ag(I) efflux system membrane protein CusB [Flammeovirgaceae bacterium 311]|nr:Cu(I)/Ag(I) efflux system membrane protein CusB [Flammeovirgaceae bacterium 311]